MQPPPQRVLKLKTAAAFEEAQVAFANGKHDVALPLFNKVLANNPEDGPALFFKKWIQNGPIEFVK